MKPCPICGGRADIDVVAPWPRDAGKAPYYANCYRMTPIEHCVGVNGDTQRETMELWNAEVDRIADVNG